MSTTNGKNHDNNNNLPINDKNHDNSNNNNNENDNENADWRCAWKWEIRNSYPSRGIHMGMGTKLPKLMGMRREWEKLKWKWECLLLMCSHLVIIFPPKSVFDLVDL